MALLRNPFKKADAFDRERDSLIRENHSVIEQAGIADAIRQNEEELSFSTFSWAAHRRMMRDTIFSVSDPQLRRAAYIVTELTLSALGLLFAAAIF